MMAERLPQVTPSPSAGGMNWMNATRQGVQVNILGSNGAAVGLPMFIPTNQSRQGGQLTHGSLVGRAIPPIRYSVRITNPEKPSQFISQQLHHFDGKFNSITAIKVHLMEKLGDQVPETINFNIGYFEGRQSKKRWLCCQEDLNAMYQCYKEGGEISLWCDSRQPGSEQSETSVRKRKQDHPTPTQRQEKEEQVDSVYRDLKEKHGNKYDNPKLRLWARMIVGGLHESTNEPPAVPAFHCESKRRKDSLSGALTDVAGVLVKYMEKKDSEDLPNQPQVMSRLGVSPGKAVDLRMKNLQQLESLRKLS